MAYNDEEYRKAYAKKWREEHSDYHRQYSKKYYAEKRDEIKAKTCGMTEEEIRKEREEKEAKKALKAAKKEFLKKMKEYKLDVATMNGNLIISTEHRAETKIPEEYTPIYDRHEHAYLLWLQRQITNKFIYISEISRQGVTYNREIYIKEDYQYLLTLPDEIWKSLNDWSFVEY